MGALRQIVIPEGFHLFPEESRENLFSDVCYQQLVLLSKPGECILDTLSSDPTFKQSSKFQRFMESEENKKLLKSTKFAEDVAAFSLREGSKFSMLREHLGDDKVELLWKGMAPNPALRPTLPAFMCAFFEDYMTVVDNPEKDLRDWYETNVTEETEVIPLFLNEAHADFLLGDEKDSFVLKSDRDAEE